MERKTKDYSCHKAFFFDCVVIIKIMEHLEKDQGAGLYLCVNSLVLLTVVRGYSLTP